MSMPYDFPMAVGLLLIVVAAAVVYGLPVLAKKRVSPAVMVLSVGYPAFGLLSLLAFRPNYIESTIGLDSSANRYFESLSPLLVFGTFLTIGMSAHIGATIIRFFFYDAQASGPRHRLRLDLRASALWAVVVIVVAQLIGIGPQTFLRSDAYLAATGPVILVKLGTALLPLAVLIAANVLFAANQPAVIRLTAVSLLSITELFLFSQGTRTFSLSFVLIFLSAWLTGRMSTRRSILWGVLAGLFSIFTLGIPLTLRGLPQHGLVPALNYLVTQPSGFFTGQSNPMYNALLGGSLTMYVWRVVPPIGNHALFVSLNPAPGGLSGWNNLAPTLRLNMYEPYGALGELLNHGWLAVILFTGALGAIFQVLTLSAKSMRGAWSSAGEALVVSFAGLLFVRSTQYNLRTESRLIYYLLVSFIILFFVCKASKTNPSVRTRSAATRLEV